MIVMNYKVKVVSPKKDSNGNLFAYSIVVVSKKNPDFTTSFSYTPEDAKKLLGINSLDQAMALVGQDCDVLKTLKLS